MARKRTVLYSDRVNVQGYSSPQEAWEEAVRGLFGRLCQVVQHGYDLPLTVELTEKREGLEIWIEAKVTGRDLGRGRNWRKYDR